MNRSSLIARAPRAVLWRIRRLIPKRPKPVILMYHRVDNDSFDPWGLAVSPARFREQLLWLAKTREVLPLAEFANMHRQGRLGAKAAAITFDDAYECVASVAVPELRHAGLPATVFVPAALIERGTPFWWDELRHIVFAHEGISLMLDGVQISLGDRSPGDAIWKPGAAAQTPRQRTFHQIWAALRERNPVAIDDAMEDLRSQISAPVAATAPRPMTPAQLRDCAGAGIEFGSHALGHPWLPSLDQSEKSREIGESVGRMQKLSGRKPTSFAYPYGVFDAESERLVREAGFDCACATMDETVSPNSGLFSLPRLQVGDWNARQLARALASSV